MRTVLKILIGILLVVLGAIAVGSIYGIKQQKISNKVETSCQVILSPAVQALPAKVIEILVPPNESNNYSAIYLILDNYTSETLIAVFVGKDGHELAMTRIIEHKIEGWTYADNTSSVKHLNTRGYMYSTMVHIRPELIKEVHIYLYEERL